jgi:hypothetical protein
MAAVLFFIRRALAEQGDVETTLRELADRFSAARAKAADEMFVNVIEPHLWMTEVPSNS